VRGKDPIILSTSEPVTGSAGEINGEWKRRSLWKEVLPQKKEGRNRQNRGRRRRSTLIGVNRPSERLALGENRERERGRGGGDIRRA